MAYTKVTIATRAPWFVQEKSGHIMATTFTSAQI